jgi:hypothetical protein
MAESEDQPGRDHGDAEPDRRAGHRTTEGDADDRG